MGQGSIEFPDRTIDLPASHAAFRRRELGRQDPLFARFLHLMLASRSPSNSPQPGGQ